MSGWQRVTRKSGGLCQTPLSQFWAPTLTAKDPQTPNLPLETPASAGGYTLTCLGGTYAVTGSQAALARNRALFTTGGTYSVSGSDATITKTTTGGAYVLTCEGGSYAIVGSNAQIEAPSPQDDVQFGVFAFSHYWKKREEERERMYQEWLDSVEAKTPELSAVLISPVATQKPPRRSIPEPKQEWIEKAVAEAQAAVEVLSFELEQARQERAMEIANTLVLDFVKREFDRRIVAMKIILSLATL